VKQETLKHKDLDKCRAKLCSKQKIWKKKTEEQVKTKRKHSVERSNKKQKLGSWQERLTKDKLKALWFKELGRFCCPNKIRKGWRGVVTTDGVIAFWHLHQDDATVSGGGKKKQKTKKSTVVVEKLENKLYGTHGPDDVLFDFKE
jgi:hypothetical protein